MNPTWWMLNDDPFTEYVREIKARTNFFIGLQD